ncbi:hypothetical protein HID58_021457 [Brassica napus]|uniref:RRM domain-containing protein n=1 Tax=Brassica napus TaxID=3708 RepID=A0ABQ8CWM7_BRANA|nr:hypothetical protein HID58_021457 [Brassica napus]
MAAVQQQQAMQKNTLYVGGLADEVNESILHAAFIPFGDIKDVKTPLDQANQKHRSFGFVTFLEREDASAAMDNMDGAELYGRVLTVNYALPEKIKGGEQGWAAHPLWADADTWFERQQQEKEILKIQAENKAAMEAAEELHRKKLAQDRQGEMEEDTEISKWIALALDAPVASIATLAAELMTSKVNVILSGGGLGELVGCVTQSSFTSSAEWLGKSEATCPSEPIPSKNRSNLGHSLFSDGVTVRFFTICLMANSYSVAALSTDTLSLMEYICLGNTFT